MASQRNNQRQRGPDPNREVDRDEHGWRCGNYSAYAPDLPGVITTGPTPEATARNMRQTITFHLRELGAAGEPIPAPTTRTSYVAAR